MSQLRSEIPFMASLWIRSGCDMKVDPSVETYQVGAHFKALIKAILVAPSRILENFFSFHVSLPRCVRFRNERSGFSEYRIRKSGFLCGPCQPQRGRETRNGKKISRILYSGTRMALMRALKWAPTWYVSADSSTFISHPDLIQRLAIKGISYVSSDIPSGGSF